MTRPKIACPHCQSEDGFTLMTTGNSWYAIEPTHDGQMRQADAPFETDTLEYEMTCDACNRHLFDDAYEAIMDSCAETMRRDFDAPKADEVLAEVFAMLRDLHENFGWDELHSTYADMSDKVRACLSRTTDPAQLTILFDGHEDTK